MKKLLGIIITILICTSCAETRTSIPCEVDDAHSFSFKVTYDMNGDGYTESYSVAFLPVRFEYAGHRYILFDEKINGTADCVVHDPDCPCYSTRNGSLIGSPLNAPVTTTSESIFDW